MHAERSWHQHNLADVLPGRQNAVRFRRFGERYRRVNDRRSGTLTERLTQGRDPRLERATVVPQSQHVETDHGFGLLELLHQVEAAQHR